ncbi:uncharacterized protein TrAtP1_006356 [Trichoderma atroviride]|uniref:uncharacterized protein n=1 Tax=Hypocrea atroviridis TaxID=63577 RepID=UPI00331D73DC|nr:hypothetical protein TrAtP1_006356 [Trichoderma atroviride]
MAMGATQQLPRASSAGLVCAAVLGAYLSLPLVQDSYVALSTEVANFILILLACIYYLASQAPWPDPPGSIVSMLMHGIGLDYIGSLLDGAGPAMAGLASHRPIVSCYITFVKTFPIVQRGCHAALFSLTTSPSSSLLINITPPGCLDSAMLESDS